VGNFWELSRGDASPKAEKKNLQKVNWSFIWENSKAVSENKFDEVSGLHFVV